MPASAAIAPEARIDTERFRLRTFFERLRREGEGVTDKNPVDLVDVAERMQGETRALLLAAVGPEKAELVGNVAGSRKRLAMAFGVPEDQLLKEIVERLQHPIDPVEISSAQAPVHQVVLTGDDADFTTLPIHLQHADDGSIYISASIDVSETLDRSRRNIGYRRMMIRGRKEAGVDMVAPSDFRAGYAEYVAKGENMPVAFIVGCYPTDGVAAITMVPIKDEIVIMGGMRKAPVPMVRCKTIDLMVPADAEMILEGYLDTKGWHEPEGPYGEYVGYYGHMKINPVFHLTAITKRRDALFQTATIGGAYLGRTDTAHLTALRTEIAAWKSLETAIREPVAVYCTASCGGMFNLRVSMRPRYPGEARNAITAIFSSLADVKHVFVVDDDIDIYSDEQIDWALATRFQADRDLIVAGGFRAMPLDPSLQGGRAGAKAGFDCTFPIGWKQDNYLRVPLPPKLRYSATNIGVRQALESGPKYFRELLEATGSRDGRDVVIALDALRDENLLERSKDTRYALKGKERPA